ncbi:hypothetical protein O181_111846 [Austropuccinia psidii MF-1]|uniref:Transposase Tc1-like domain-containing protein n=1 Tax=Austropuccinia psidii MF-1 TaxID=1389203 RepID=A0A9Q3K184_9BASI|nr:hypothetical protein [Austropuccinia psidii MF-1]
MQIGLFKEHHLMPCKHPTNNYPPIMPHLDIETRGQIVGMCQAGLSFGAIGQLAGVPLTIIYDTVTKYQQIGTVKTQQKTRRPTILKDCDRRQLSRIITHFHCLTVAQAKNLMTEIVFTRIIRREIHKLGKASRIAPRKPYLQPQDFQAQLLFAQSHMHWGIDDWEKVLWTDESAFELGKKVDRVCVWCTPQEKWLLENLAVNHCSGRTKDIGSTETTGLPTSSLSFHQPKEQAPWIMGRHRLIVMEDNAPIHTATLRNQWRQQHGI